ncbi:uncharacterized protein DUF348 [Streptomyces sp. CEV 2-1]|nr:uncharacterized protein DUF348 [Streptomyces sp. CEV 2-1]
MAAALTVASGAVPAAGGGRAGARRAGRRRRVSGRPENLRRLVPQALVVAFLAGGTCAFIADDKAVTLDIDGEPRTLHTFADDVGELLADEGIAVDGHRTVSPVPATALGDGDEITVRSPRPVTLTLDGVRRRVVRAGTGAASGAEHALRLRARPRPWPRRRRGRDPGPPGGRRLDG